jgi:hypothetical protein
MRSPLVLSVLAALLVVSVALAAKPQTATATIDQLGASGISGTADLRIDQSGNARIHEQLSGLTPGAEYVSVIYLNTQSCGSGLGVVPVELMTFTANPAGRATFNTVIPPQAVPAVEGGASISIQQGSTLLACGVVVPE